METRDLNSIVKSESMTLDDKAIRSWLINRLSSSPNRPRAILEELRVHNGNAIADVVTVHQFAHCYEIKGDNDSIHRILRQSQFYDLAFKRITLVTTRRHIENAMRLSPPHWGIMSAREDAGVVRFSYIRPAKPSQSFEKQVALLTLWRSELVDVAIPLTTERLEKLSRLQLSRIISLKLDGVTINRCIGDKLSLRSNISNGSF